MEESGQQKASKLAWNLINLGSFTTTLHGHTNENLG